MRGESAFARARIVTVVLGIVLTLTMAMLSACDKNTAASQLDGNAADTLLGAIEAGVDGEALTYWAELNGNAAGIKPTFQEVPFFQEWQKKTRVKLDFIQPPQNQAKDAINVLLASGELPDMMEYEWNSFPGGPEKAIKDGYILRLNEAIDAYAPNLKKYLSEHPEIDKQIRTADGSYYMFPFIQGDERLRTYQGLILRKDWLDELGLGVPVTIHEWHTVLKAFKERKGIEAPLTFLGVPSPLFGIDGGGFIGAYGIKKDFYVEDGQVKFGPQEAGYRDFLALFRDWYAEGLIDRNFAAVDSMTQDVSMLTGRSGASIWNAGAGIGTWLPVLRENDPGAKLIAAPYPVLHKGERSKFGQRASAVGFSGVAISSKSKHVEQAVRMLDYGYGPEGHMLFNFGIEGLSYEMKDGYPRYTDLILNNPDKLAPSQALAMYTRASYFGPFVQDIRYMEQYYMLPEQKEAIRLWSDTDAAIYALPSTPKTEKESAELSAIMQDVTTLVDEMSLKIILGIEPLSAFDAYVEQLKSLNIDRAIGLQQTALERYNQSLMNERGKE
ncbi:extracellular solute-binding protein [Paenibacillus woosongensis]|uniref:Extracellular solute-binding protein n=1 Tax=Paenibacillus woosongensis TaxID=307580 RepID=A0A7X2YXE1_9BACL|nr:extracellular solute-binding protein [Paenibacillus woosongensis]MUG43505.1 extracellular solute-binding protein [Paenibacillus woosongensis]